VKPRGHAHYVSHGMETLVRCVQTPNRTWFARRNGTCYFTGNTIEQSTLCPGMGVLGGTWDD
jgi:hypothetical protein